MDFASYELIAGTALVISILGLLAVGALWFDRFCDKHGVDDWPQMPPKSPEDIAREGQR